MRIAVPYENGKVFQHFGHTENFKIYTIDNGRIVDSNIVSTDGSGHEALAGFLSNLEIDALICGGCGDGAVTALSGHGIEVVSGIDGDTDIAVEAYLNGELTSAGVNCDHHSHGNGHECGSGCGGGCAGCHGGCGSAPLIEGKNVGKVIRVHYHGTLEDGSKFDSSYDREEPLEFICGIGMMIHGFDAACANLDVGQVVDVTIPPEKAYGMPDPQAIFNIEKEQLPGSENLHSGEQVVLTNSMGQSVQALVATTDDTTVTFDTNHPLVGKTLNFRIEMVEIM